MKAAQIDEYGGRNVVKIREILKPGIKPDQILIEIKAAGVNPVDWKIREGYMKLGQLPATLGGDFSGTVIEVGKEVTDLKKGDDAYGTSLVLAGGSGSFSEFAAAKSGTASLKPKNLSHEEAASLPLVGVSAIQGLLENIKISKGQKILIHGGAGGIGSVSIQLAKHLGAYVATTVSTNDVEFAKKLGADKVIDYKKQDFTKSIKDYEAVFDTVGGETYKKSFQVMKKGGIIVSMLEQPDQELMKQFGVMAIGEFTQINSQKLSKLREFAEKHVIKANVDKTFPLGQADEALESLKNNHPRGKIVITVKG